MNLCLLRTSGLFICGLLAYGPALASDEELLGIVAQNLGSPTNAKAARYLDAPVALDSKATEQKLKKLSAFGLTFAGRAKLDGGKFNALSYWTDDPLLPAAVAEEAFKGMAAKLQEQHGSARLSDVPNFEDASTSVTRVLRWHVADEVLLLSIHRRSSNASLTLERKKRDAWLADMGTDESEFWQATLQREAEASKPELPKAPSPIPDQSPPTTFARPMATPTAMPVAPSAPKVAESPAPTVERGAPVWPWVVGILTLLAIVAIASKRRA